MKNLCCFIAGGLFSIALVCSGFIGGAYVACKILDLEDERNSKDEPHYSPLFTQTPYHRPVSYSSYSGLWKEGDVECPTKGDQEE